MASVQSESEGYVLSELGSKLGDVTSPSVACISREGHMDIPGNNYYTVCNNYHRVIEFGNSL